MLLPAEMTVPLDFQPLQACPHTAPTVRDPERDEASAHRPRLDGCIPRTSRAVTYPVSREIPKRLHNSPMADSLRSHPKIKAPLLFHHSARFPGHEDVVRPHALGCSVSHVPGS